MKTYRHSGTLGDLIYSLSIVPKLGAGQFMVAINNIENCVAEYGYRADEVAPEHRGRFTTADFERLAPLLERQSYITDTCTWHQGDPAPDVDLDRFRGTLFRGFEGNYVQAYHLAFGLPFAMQDYDTPWLEADPITTKPIVVSRTARYRSTEPFATGQWMAMAHEADLANNGIFVGTRDEHEEFVESVKVNIPYRPVSDFLELAGIVAGADLVAANQNFVYSLAMGLKRPAILETIKIKPLQNNECFFPRTELQYW